MALGVLVSYWNNHLASAEDCRPGSLYIALLGSLLLLSHFVAVSCSSSFPRRSGIGHPFRDVTTALGGQASFLGERRPGTAYQSLRILLEAIAPQKMLALWMKKMPRTLRRRAPSPQHNPAALRVFMWDSPSQNEGNRGRPPERRS